MDEPKKYIRTLEGDIKTVEEGGKPDLAPLNVSQPSAKEQLVEASPLQPSPTQIPIPTPEPTPTGPTFVPKPPSLAPVKTYESDFSQRVKETGAVTATILAAEQDATPESVQEEEKPEQSKKNLIYIISGTVLVAIGLGGATFAYIKYAPSVAPVITQEAQAPIFVDERQEISGNGTLLMQAIVQSLSRNLPSRTVRFLYTASSTIDGNSIFTTIPISVPDIVRRNVNAEGSMAGVVNTGVSSGPGTGGSQSPFFILSVAAYRDTFAGMLSWESTMPSNLSGLFPAHAPITASTTVATTTSTSSGRAAALGFRDEVVSNHDVRVYRDSVGRSVLLYGYWNQKTLVIARDPLAFTEIVSRLATARLPAQAGTQR